MPDPMQMPVRSGFGRRSSLCGRTIEPNQIEDHIGGCPHVSEQVIELWPARFVGCDDLTIEYRVADIE